MPTIEEILSARKMKFDQLTVPADLEVRLHSALQNRCAPPTRKRGWKAKLAAAMLVLLLIGSQADTLAYYGKQLIGYDQVMNGTLQHLNALGKGQLIGKSYTFSNGTVFTLDGIMLDDNQLLAFYTIKAPPGITNVEELMPTLFICAGKDRYVMRSSYGNQDTTKKSIKCVASFEPPRFFQKKLRLVTEMIASGKRETGEIVFLLERKQAMGHTLKMVLHKDAAVDEATLRFKSITVSPTMTVIDGSVQSSLELAWDQFTHTRIRPNDLAVELIANGKVVAEQGGEMRTDLHGITFRREYDTLPAELKKLQIKLVSFGADYDADQQIELSKGANNRIAAVLGQKIKINQVYEAAGDTYVTLTTAEKVRLSRVYMLMDGRRVGLKQTIRDRYTKQADGKFAHIRTLHFPGTGHKLQLDIRRLAYAKTYNKTIDIAVR